MSDQAIIAITSVVTLVLTQIGSYINKRFLANKKEEKTDTEFVIQFLQKQVAELKEENKLLRQSLAKLNERLTDIIIKYKIQEHDNNIRSNE